MNRVFCTGLTYTQSQMILINCANLHFGFWIRWLVRCCVVGGSRRPQNVANNSLVVREHCERSARQPFLYFIPFFRRSFHMFSTQYYQVYSDCICSVSIESEFTSDTKKKSEERHSKSEKNCFSTAYCLWPNDVSVYVRLLLLLMDDARTYCVIHAGICLIE